MILNHLKQATRQQHAALEVQMPVLNPQLTRPHYQQLLRRFFGYYAPLEMGLFNLPWWDDLEFSYTERFKTPQLARDLLVLGDTPEMLAQIPFCHELPTVQSLANLLGCLYVIEGATLGGQVIAKHLQKNLGISSTSGGEFFNGYGLETMNRWHACCSMLNQQAELIRDDKAIIATAEQTFVTLGQWLFPSIPISISQ